jgi:hypothetical protein
MTATDLRGGPCWKEVTRFIVSLLQNNINVTNSFNFFILQREHRGRSKMLCETTPDKDVKDLTYYVSASLKHPLQHFDMFDA